MDITEKDYPLEESRTYQGAGVIQFWGGEINTLQGGLDQPRTAMYKLDMPKGISLAGHIDLITGLLYQHAQERGQESGQAIAIGLIKGEWAGEITGLYVDMLWYCAGPSALAAEYANVHSLVEQWAIAPEAYSGAYVRHIGQAKEAATTDQESIEGGAI